MTEIITDLVLSWSDEMPTAPGIYFCRIPQDNFLRIYRFDPVRQEETGEEFGRIYAIGYEECRLVRDGMNIQWYGPVIPELPDGGIVRVYSNGHYEAIFPEEAVDEDNDPVQE